MNVYEESWSISETMLGFWLVVSAFCVFGLVIVNYWENR